jgi:hypothetical protein
MFRPFSKELMAKQNKSWKFHGVLFGLLADFFCKLAIIRSLPEHCP